MTRIARLFFVLAIGLLQPFAAQSQTTESAKKPTKLPKRFQPLEKSNLWTLVSVFGNDQWVDGESIGDVAVSKDGKWGLSASYQNAVRLWDLSTGDCVRILAKSPWHETGVAFLPDEKHIISAKWTGELEIIDCETGELKRTIKANTGIRNVAAIPGGNRIVYCTWDDEIYMIDLKSDHSVKLDYKKIKNGYWKLMRFPEDGKMLALVTREKMEFYDPDSGRLIQSLEKLPSYVTSFVFFKDGRRCLVGFGNGTVGVYDTKTWKMIHSFQTNVRDIKTIGLTKEEKRVFVGFGSYTLALFRLDDGKELWREKGPSVTGCAMTPDGKSVFTGSVRHGVMLWDLETGKPRSHKKQELGTARPIGFLGELIVTRGVDATTQVNFWKPDGIHVRNFALDPGWDPAGIAKDGRVLAHHFYQGNGLLNLETNQITLLKNSERVDREIFSKDMRWLFGYSRGTLKKWNVETGDEVSLPNEFKALEKQETARSYHYHYHFESKKAVRFNGPLNTRGSTVPIGKMEFLDLVKDKMIATSSNEGLVPIAFSDDGDLVLADRYLSRGQELSLWDHQTGQNLRNFKSFEAPLIAAVFSPSRRYVIALSKDTILKMFETATGEVVDQMDFQKINDFPATICMSKDFKKMLIGTQRGLSLYFESK